MERRVALLLQLLDCMQVVLLGVCCSDNDDLQLQPLPLYSCPTDGVTMTCVTATKAGRIFMGGADGHLYELCYVGGGMRWGKRCYKVRAYLAGSPCVRCCNSHTLFCTTIKAIINDERIEV